MPWTCGVALHTRYSREFDIPVLDKSDAFSRLLQWLAAETKLQSRYKQKFELFEFDITRFDCMNISASGADTPGHLSLPLIKYAKYI